VATKKPVSTPEPVQLFRELTPAERRDLLREMPGVIVHERDPAHTEWTFKPWIRVRDGVDVNALIEREQDEDALDFLTQ
jgi:hypothetical protein